MDIHKKGQGKEGSVADEQRDFGIGAQILSDFGIEKIRLISNHSSTKRVGLIGYGLEIVEYVELT